MKILVAYRGIPQSPGWATGDMVVKAFRELGHDVTPYGNYYQTDTWMEEVDSVAAIRDHEYDLALYMECNDADPTYGGFKLVKARKTACWLFDTSYYTDHLTGFNNFFQFNHQFIANPLDMDKFPNSSYLPYACDPELHSRPLDFPKAREVALVGSIRPDRVKLQKELKKNGIKLELIGGIFREDYIDALASSRIIINQNPSQGRGLLNMRWFETAAAGSIVIGEASDLSVNDIFCFGEAHQYHSIDGLVELCKTYLSLQENQDFLRNTTHRNVHEQHTYKNRCQQILNTLFPHETT